MTTTHQLTYVDTVVREADATVDKDGNIVITSVPEVLDYYDSEIYCSACGLLGSDEYEAHGISENWELL